MTLLISRVRKTTRWLLFATATLALGVREPALARQQRSDVELPPVSWTCPMHPEIVEAQKGICPICQMDLAQVRLRSVWSCPVHSVVAETAAGKCPICRRELAQMTVALSFTCPETPDINQVDPGKCADGSAMLEKLTPRAHGNHSPQHGGGFFMAADNWHHVEGTYPEEGLFRLFVFDDYTKPLAVDRARQVTGRVVTKSTIDEATLTEHEAAAYPLQLVENAHYLEARIDRLAPPAEMTVKLQLTLDGPESRFDFTFPTFTKDPGGVAFTTADVDPSQLMVEIPNDPQEVLAMLLTRSEQIHGFIQQGAFGQIYVPALQAKDLALALDVHASALPPSRRSRVAPAVIDVVRSAWMLDSAGDMGNREQVTSAYEAFARAVSKLQSAFTLAAAGPQR